MAEPLPERLHEWVAHNVSALAKVREEKRRKRSLGDRLSDQITRFAGSMAFVFLHVAWFAIWIIVNLGWTPLPQFDPFPFGLLTMIVSLEAIFLSTFVLISQNQMMADSEERAALDLQVNLLTEHELTKLVALTDAIADHLGVVHEDVELKEIEAEITADDLLREIAEDESESRS